MRIIESIKETLRNLREGLNPPPSKARLYLKRGTMAQIEKATPFYVGEIVLCLDEPYFGVGTKEGFDLIPIGETFTCAADALREHYSDISW